MNKRAANGGQSKGYQCGMEGEPSSATGEARYMARHRVRKSGHGEQSRGGEREVTTPHLPRWKRQWKRSRRRPPSRTHSPTSSCGR